MAKIIVCQGLPASGKSTWAKEQVSTKGSKCKRVNKDDLRSMIDCGRHSKSNEEFVIKVRDFIIEESITSGKDIIVDDTNLDPSHIKRFNEIAKSNGVEVEIVDFTDISLQTCLDRDSKRETPVGDKAIMFMYNKYIKSNKKDSHVIPNYPQNDKLCHAVVFDLDGTLADISHRSPFDVAKCPNDSPNVPVVSIFNMYKTAGYRMIILTGRSDKYETETKKWLKDNDIQYNELYMRTHGDHRKDVVAKKELFETHIYGEWFVQCFYEDRNQMVELWRSMGFPCMQVAEGNF